MIYTKYDKESGRITGYIYNDPERALRSLRQNEDMVEGEYSLDYVIVNGEPVLKSQEELDQAELSKAWEELRMKRNTLLNYCDFTQLEDSPYDKERWADYRRQLRDLPQNTSDPREVVWPEQPGE